MLSLVHIYAATEVSKKKTPLLVIGSVLPDLVWIDRNNFSSDKLHDDLNDFYSFVDTKYPEMLDLALGMKLHSNKIGADKYSHFYKGGYSYVKGNELLDGINDLVDSKDEKRKKDLSHNFIESALDMHLLGERPEMLNLYKESFARVDLNKIAMVTGDYSKLSFETVKEAIDVLFYMIFPDNLGSKEVIAAKVLPKMIKSSFEEDVKEENVLPVLEKAIEVSKKDYKTLFSEMILEMKKDFPEFS